MTIGRQLELTQDDPPDDLVKVENIALYINLVFTTIFLYDSSWVTVTANLPNKTDSNPDSITVP